MKWFNGAGLVPPPLRAAQRDFAAVVALAVQVRAPQGARSRPFTVGPIYLTAARRAQRGRQLNVRRVERGDKGCRALQMGCGERSSA